MEQGQAVILRVPIYTALLLSLNPLLLHDFPFLFFITLGIFFFIFITSIFNKIQIPDWIALGFLILVIILVVLGMHKWLSLVQTMALIAMFVYQFNQENRNMSQILLISGCVLTLSPAVLMAGNIQIPYAILGYGLILFGILYFPGKFRGLYLKLILVLLLISVIVPLPQFFSIISLIFWISLAIILLLKNSEGKHTVLLNSLLISLIVLAGVLGISLWKPVPWGQIFESAYSLARILFMIPLYANKNIYESDQE